MKWLVGGIAALWAAIQPIAAEEMPRLEHRDGRYMMRVDGKPFLILAAQIHNSSAWPDTLVRAWPAAEALSPNTIEAPVYWEQFEAVRGRYDTRNVDALIAKARASGKRLILLWFGTWKNGQMHYVPAWMKADTATYPRMIDARGEPIDVMSPHAATNLAAERAFAGPVPADLLAKLGRQAGTWRTVFGPDAEEAFGAWATARFIDDVAAAGRTVYPLPVYVNTWLRYKDKKYPGIDYPSGGAVWTMLDLWRAAAPSIDFIGADIYTDDADEYVRVLDRYARADNPSWVSETGFDAKTAPFLFYMLARGGLGFSVFGIDDDPMTPAGDAAVAAHKANFALLDPIRDIVAQAGFDRRLFAAVEAPGRAKQSLDLGTGWQAALSFGPPPWGDTPAILGNSPRQSGRAMVIRLSTDEWLIAGIDARVELKRIATDGLHGQLLRAEEGEYRAGQWHAIRWLNGDETDYDLNFGATPRLVKVTTGSF